MLNDARAAAQDVLVEQAWLTVSPDQFEEFRLLLDAQPKANERLRRTMHASRPWQD